jgi:hypothetical protein
MTNSLLNRTDILQDRRGLKLASYLSLSVDEVSHEVSERLRVARVQALAQRKTGPAQVLVMNGASAALTWGNDEGLSWWSRLGAVMPLIALVVGLLFINSVQNDNRARELAEVDVALLIDELPPAAFSDPGFVQFLKTDL